MYQGEVFGRLTVQLVLDIERSDRCSAFRDWWHLKPEAGAFKRCFDIVGSVHDSNISSSLTPAIYSAFEHIKMWQQDLYCRQAPSSCG